MRRANMAIALLALGTLAQTPQIRIGVAPYALTPLTLQTQSNLVPVEVVVRHEDGSVVAGLTRGNFRVFNGGQIEPLSQFFVVNRAATPAAKETAPPGELNSAAAASVAAEPRYVALWFDDVNTSGGDLKHARNAALEFLHHGRDPGDRIGIFTASGTQQAAFTGDVSALTAAVQTIRAHPRQSQYGIGSCPRITPFQAYQISVLHYPEAIAAAMAEYQLCSTGGVGTRMMTSGPMIGPAAPPQITSQADATWNLAVTVSENTQDDIRGVIASLVRQTGRRVLLLASGGFLTETLETRQERLINAALRANVVINALDARGLYTISPSRPMSELAQNGVLPLITFFYEQQSQLNAAESEDDAMVQLAQSTGGLFFHNSNDLELGFERLGLAPPLTYELAFVPAALPHDGKFHKLRVELEPPIKGAIIQARRGYFDPAKDTPASELGPALDRAMRDETGASGVPANVTEKPEPGGVGVDVHFDIARVPFVDQHGRHNQTLTVIAGLFSSGGQYVTGKRGVLELALTSAGYKHFRSQGMGATLRLTAQPGRYRLRVAIGEASDGKLSAFTRQVEVH